MNKRFFNQQNLTRRLRLLPVLFAMLLMPLSAWAEDYPLIVAGVQVTDENATGITGTGITTGTVSFTPASGDNPATLTLNKATIDMSEIPGFCPIESSIANLTIQLIGYNKLTPNSDNFNGIKFTDGTTTGNLTFTTSNVVEEYGSLSVDGIYQFSDLTSGYNVTNSFTTGEQTGWSKTESGGSGQTYNSVRIDYTEYYDVWVGGARLSSSSLSPVSGGTKYIPSTHTLHLAGYGYNDEIKSGLPEFIVEVSGSNNSVSNITFEGDTPGTIIFKKDESSVSGNKVDFTGSVKGFSSVTITPPLQLVSPSGVDNPTSAQWNSFTNVSIADFTTTYNIAVGGKNVTNANASDILGDGTVSYDSENNILTLNDATIIPESEEYGITYTGTTDLVISLNGTSNVVKGVGGCPAIGYFNNDVQTAPSLTFTNGSETDPCKLQLEAVGEPTIAGFGSVVNTGLYKIDETILGGDQPNTYKTTITSTLLSGGSGTSADPFIVGTADDLKNFAKYVNDGILSTEYIKLGGNIDCTNLTGFEPIGNNTKSFIGTFNGDGNSITGLTFSNTNPDGVSGLFGEIGSIDTNNDAITRGTVKNLTLNGCQFGNGGQNGAIAGYLHYGTIENCTVTSCTISSGNSQSTYSGGITGMIYNGIVKDCTVNGGTITSSITNSGDGYVYAGGIVAYAYSDSNINGCTVTDVSINSTGNGQNSYSGGIVGYSEATISGNSVKGSTTVNSSNNDNIETLVGAIVANRAEGCSLTNNYYYYTVKTKTTSGNNDPVEKSGYTQRGIGGTSYNATTQENEPNPDVFTNKGAVMYTTMLTMPVESASGAVIGDVGGFYAYAEGDTYGILGAPGQPVKVKVIPGDDFSISSIGVTYGTDQTAEISLTNTEDGTYFYTISEMPDVDATLNVTFSQAYDLWIGSTQVTDANASNVLGNGTVSFTVSGGGAAAPTYTLTLNDAVLTQPIKVGLTNLTIDIQGTNSITTTETCIQNTSAAAVPTLTFKSTSDVVGSLTLTNNSGKTDDGVFSTDFNFSIDKALAPIILRNGSYISNTYYITAGEVHNVQFVPSYGVQVNDMQVYEGNATNVLGNGKVSFDKTTHTLTLNNANGIEAISTTLSTLDIDLVGSNSLYRESNGSIFESASGEAVTINLKSTGATGSLTIETPANYGATLKGDNVTLTPVDPIVLLSSDVTENKGTLVYGVSYGLTVAGVTVSNINASNVLGDDETATVVFTPANATEATPATLTLNGAESLGSIVSGLENLKVVINGENTALEVKANSAVSGNKNITFVGGTNGGTNAATLTISAGDGGSAVSGFASVSYDGAYAAANVPFAYVSPKGYVKSHMMGDNSYLETLTITTVPHYPIWLYKDVTTATQVNNTNKNTLINTLLNASGNISFDGSNILTLQNVNCEARIVSGLSELTISIDGDCIIESPDSGSVVRSINSAAPLTIEKASGASSASLKLATVSKTAVKAFASLDYTGLILLSEGATYTSGALNDSNNQPLNEAIFTTGLKKPTLQMNYETDTYSFQNPNGGGTLKYSRYFANNEGTDEENQVDNGNTFQIFKNGRQYNDPYTVYFEVWVEANGNSSDKLYACRLDVKDMAATYGGTVPAPEFLPKAIEGVTVSGYSLGTRTAVAATVTEGNITLTGAGRQELDAIFSLPDGVEYIKTSTTETPQASFYLDVKPEKPTLSKAAGTYAGTQTITVTNLTPNATAWYYTYEGEEPASPNAQAFPEGGVDISSSKTLAVYYRAEYETETSMEYLYSETTKVAYTILADPELKYMQGATAVTTAEWTLGKDDNTALPVLQNTHSVAVTYESSNTDVATVATDGTVTAVGIGTATITATSAATSEYAAGEASYTLTVKRQLTVSFSASNEWATYYASENLATPTGLVAYQVTAVDGSTVTIGEIGYIPANTAVLLKNVSNNNTWSNIAASAYTGATSPFASNKLIGTASDVDVSTISGGTVYVLYNNMFKRATGGTIPANRGYLVVAPSSGNAPELSITIGDDTTGVQTLNVERGTLNDDSWYTIDGRKVNGQSSMVNGQLKPGLYIKNGKKVFINKK